MEKPLSWFRNQRDRHGSAQLSGRGPQGLSRLPAAGRVHLDEPVEIT